MRNDHGVVPDVVFTIGHSTHEEPSFLRLLRAHAIEAVADVRRWPSSRHHPQFNAENLERVLGGEGIAYLQLGEELGGRRRAAPDSPNAGWRVAGFRGYADHMATSEFRSGLERLEELARERRAALVCAEGPWWRCHRQLIADALLARGWRVVHILPDAHAEEHRLTPFGRVLDGGRVVYPGETLTGESEAAGGGG